MKCQSGSRGRGGVEGTRSGLKDVFGRSCFAWGEPERELGWPQSHATGCSRSDERSRRGRVNPFSGCHRVFACGDAAGNKHRGQRSCMDANAPREIGRGDGG